MIATSILSICLFLCPLSVESAKNDLWILLEDTSVYPCRGVTNKIAINERDISVHNEYGKEVHYLKAPGKYILNFNNMQVTQDLPNLSGQLNGILQVPVVEVGKLLNWDYPYQLIPEKQAFGANKCDKNSGPVTDEGKAWCRYCDLCDVAGKTEQQLKMRKYLPEVGKNDGAALDKACLQIDSKSYTMQRTIELPDKNELERQANAQFSGVSGEMKKKFNKGKGKLQMQLEMMSSQQQPLDKATIFAQSVSCRCCNKGGGDVSCKVGSSCNQDNCMAEYSQKCTSQATKVACYTVQFNYQVTDSPDEVKQFLQRNGYQDEYGDFDAARPNLGPRPSGGNSGNVARPTDAQSGAGSRGNGNTGTVAAAGASNDAASRQRCIARMKDDRFQRFCGIRWQANFCCTQCNGC